MLNLLRSLGVAGGLVTLAVGSMASAQDTEVEAVVVTGSRLTGVSLATPTPVTSVGALEIGRQAPASIGETMVTLPAFRASSGPSTAINSLTGTAQTLLDLRGLGASRTLVLVNGLRRTPVNANGTFDTNLLPTGLIERVEVVTGGASAAYGSDAVAGVANFILNTRYEGLSGTLQYGVTQAGDGREPLARLTYGTGFAEGRGRFVFGAEYSANSGVESLYDRDWGRREPGLLALSATRAAGLPSQIVAEYVEQSAFTFGGIIPSGPLRGTAFDAAGQPYAFPYGAITGATEMIGTGNYGASEYASLALRTPYERGVALARGEFDLGDDLMAFAELSYGELSTHTYAGTCCRPQTFTIARDNPYLPAATRAAMVSAGLQTISVGRRSLDYDTLKSGSELDTLQAAAGVKGKLAGWTWDAAVTAGRSRYDLVFLNNPRTADLMHSAYAVRDPVSGAIVCGPAATDPYFLAQAASVRAQLNANLKPGCQPFNVFGDGRGNAAATAYFMGASQQSNDIRQTTASLSLSGEPFTLPAGPVSVAAGAEWRRDRAEAVGCADCLTGAYVIQNLPSYSGEVTVKEAFAEVGVPVVRDAPLVAALDLNAAARRTDYSTSGGVTTWKLGAVWKPVEALRLRVTRSRDIRAPNINELYNPGSATRANVTNKLTGVSGIVDNLTAGNLALQPEIADTVTAGLTFHPEWAWASGFQASVDWYSIEIAEVIGTVTPQDVLDRYLLQGLNEYRPYITFDGSALGFSRVNGAQQNLSAQKTSGVDIELAYRAPLERLNLPGRLDVRALATWVDDIRNIQSLSSGGVSDVDVAGQSVPEWQVNVSANYVLGRLDLGLNARAFSEVKYSTSLVGPENPTYSPAANNSINRNIWPGLVYWRASAAYDLVSDGGRRLQVFGVVDNLFDKDPPPISISILGGSPYDNVGRAFKLGVRFSY